MKEIPVIIFTVSHAVEDTMEEIQDPRLGILRKPVSFTELRGGSERYLGNK